MPLTLPLQKALERIVLNPEYHELLTLVKGIRNGIVYGTKVRFPHALVMIFLFRSGSLRSKAWLVFKATRTHARNLGLFAFVYKTTMLLLRHTSPTGKERQYDSFLAGLLGGYTVFGRTIHNSVSQQIVIYVFARVALALAKLAVQPKRVGDAKGGGGGWGMLDEHSDLRKQLVKNGWVGFASLSWAMVMYVWRWHPEAVQPSLRSSMNYMWVLSFETFGSCANEALATRNRTTGIHCATSSGIINDGAACWRTAQCRCIGAAVRFVYIFQRCITSRRAPCQLIWGCCITRCIVLWILTQES